MIDLASTAIDPAAAENQPFLRHLQGGILTSHGRDHLLVLFLRFVAPPRECREWLGSFAAARVTSARRQLDEAERFRQGEPGGLFASVFLTFPGYVALGWPAEEIAARFPEVSEPDRVTWKDGMAAAAQELSDLPPSQWEEPYRDRRIHLMVLLADDHPDRLQEAGREIEEGVVGPGVGEILGRETGTTLRDGDDRPVEPFGFLDGRSQPLFLRREVEEERDRNGGAFQSWDPGAPLGLAVLADPLATEEDACGSYLVFRKLEQDVRGFRQRLTDIAARVAHGDPRLAGAMAVGRFEDGTPVLASAVPTGGIPANDFDFASAFNGRCPLHAHIRKVNPRGGTAGGLQAEREHRIVRRSIPYGGEPNPLALPAGGVGLLFMCFQRSISHQFAFVQKRWANESDFLHAGTGIDPLIGQPSGAAPIARSRWPDRWDSEQFVGLDFRGFVRFRGGELFFAPSLPFLLSLATTANPAGSARTPGRAPRAGRGRPPG